MRRFRNEIRTAAGRTTARTCRSPVIRNTKATNAAPVPMMKMGSSRFLRGTFLSTNMSQIPAIPSTTHVMMNRGSMSGRGFIDSSVYPNSTCSCARVTKTGDCAQNRSQATSSARNCAKERIFSTLSLLNPCRSSSSSRFSYNSLPKTSLTREFRNWYFWSMSLRRRVK